MNILVAIERLKEIALIHPDAVMAGFNWTHEDFAEPATEIVVQTDRFEDTTTVYFEYV